MALGLELALRGSIVGWQGVDSNYSTEIPKGL